MLQATLGHVTVVTSGVLESTWEDMTREWLSPALTFRALLASGIPTFWGT